MRRRPRVPRALSSLFILLSGCAKHEASKPSGSERAEIARAVPSVRVQPTRSEPVASTLAASWPETKTLAPISADQLRARIRASGKKGTLVNAWASWCGPCREELPMLSSMAKNLAAQAIDVVLVSVDEPEDHSKAEAFLKSFDIALPAYLAARPLGDFKVGLNPRWPGMLPASFFFDGTGKLRYFWGGEAFEHEIVAVIDGFLAGKPIDGESDFALAPGQHNP